MATVKKIKYACADCGAEDEGKFFEHEMIPFVINCWQCGAGQGIQNVQEMMRVKKGMVRISE